MQTQPARRKFLKTGCLTTAAIGITLCAGGTLAATYQPAVDMPSAAYGENIMTDRILVTYASKAGSTAEVAARIGETLAARGLPVDVLPIGKVKDLAPYRQVILGSAVRISSPLPEAVKFVEANQAALQQKSFSAFLVCMTMKDDNEETRKTVSAYVEPIRALVKPASEGLFAGVIDPSKVNLLDKMAIKMIKAPIGDFRQWDQITAWAENLA